MKKSKTVSGPVLEQQIHAEFLHYAMCHNAKILGYPPVVAGGSRANTLHYIANDMPVHPGELVLVDAGVEHHGYCGDITRTFPVSGKFTDAQRELYEIVLRTNERCLERLRLRRSIGPITLNGLHEYSLQVMAEQLEKSANLNVRRLRRDLYPHHVGHYLGIDIHDTPTASKSVPLQEGMIITVEPGLYFPFDNDLPQRFRGIGIRIEDNVLLTEDGAEVLTSRAPKTVNEIEDIMK